MLKKLYGVKDYLAWFWVEFFGMENLFGAGNFLGEIIVHFEIFLEIFAKELDIKLFFFGC